MRERTPRSLLGLTLFTGAYMLASIITSMLTGNTEFFFYTVVMIVLITVVLAVHLRLRLTAPLLWAMSIWGLLHMAGGLVPVPASWPIDGETRVLYSWWIIPGPEGSTPGDGTGGWLKYDQITHAYGFGTATWFCWQTLVRLVKIQTKKTVKPTFGIMALVAIAGMGLGALNELIEFAATRFTETNVGGYFNTGMDLVFNAIGCVVAVAIITASLRNERDDG